MTTTRAAIRCEALGKRYRVAQRGSGSYRTAREAMHAAAGALLGRRSAKNDHEQFWSLRDLDLEVPAGEALGVIGRNGAGKTTLLRILAGITEPTAGRATVRGRTGSLLEVGTGFHPELTGRENVFLSGAILGMRRAEIRRRFDEIVQFAEVERFLDAPVKRYSTGMHMRLAFAVVAHLDCEVLLVDEVLAVGDAAFQRRCLDRMDRVSGSGRTVLFVSHDLTAVQRLCSRAVLLDRGTLAMAGPPDEVVATYLGSTSAHGDPGAWIDLADAPREGTGEARFARFRAARALDAGSVVDRQPLTDAPLVAEVIIEATEPLLVETVKMYLRDARGTKLLDVDSALLGQTMRLPAGRTTVRFAIDALHLNPGAYSVGLWLARGAHDGTGIDHVQVAAEVEVQASEPERLVGFDRRRGPVSCRYTVSLHEGAGGGG